MSSDGRPSRTVNVLIQRAADDGRDAAETRSTARSLRPQARRSRAARQRPWWDTRAEAGDVLTYKMGSPPAPTHGAGLSGIDIVSPGFQIHGRRVCAETFTFAAAPVGIDFEG